MATDFVIVAQGTVAGIHQLANRRPVGSADALGGMNGALDFTNDMARAAENHFVHPAFRKFERLRCGVAQGRHAENFRGGFALFAARGIFTAGQFVFHVGVDDEHGD